ncbi:hypothetical protein EYC84_006815 [Monilinia fructicola]|uniref:Uncharacterized protein n=1 Tax=Monilinia fructicola TaxID=38448 RepID=A0A5M9K743_MONFR|nr:hypothetical protein EYC84_006815 [Monilinia fructicola]
MVQWLGIRFAGSSFTRTTQLKKSMAKSQLYREAYFSWDPFPLVCLLAFPIPSHPSRSPLSSLSHPLLSHLALTAPSRPSLQHILALSPLFPHGPSSSPSTSPLEDKDIPISYGRLCSPLQAQSLIN